ncbi:MAG: hypothetical protein WBJ87_07715 [Candidatus Hydrothermia bacterium]
MSAANMYKKENLAVCQDFPDVLINETLDLFNIRSTSNNEYFITQYIINYISKIKNVNFEMDDYGNILITKGLAESYPCFTAHLDTVYTYPNGLHAKISQHEETGHIIIVAEDKNGKQIGVGGDDKCGIWIILRLLKTQPILKAVLCSREESGADGSENVNLSFFKNCRYLIGIDRWGNNDFVTNYNFYKTISNRFEQSINPILKKFAYSHTHGLMTDCFIIQERGLNISCANMSCGYYCHHSTQEFVVLNEMYHAFLLATELCKLQDIYKYNIPKPVYKYQKSYKNWWADTQQYNEYCIYCGKPLAFNVTGICNDCKNKYKDIDYLEI